MAARNVIVFGGAGQLGDAVVGHFQGGEHRWNVVSVDFRANAKAAHNIVLTGGVSSSDRAAAVAAEIVVLGIRFDAVICVAGGWAGGSIGADDVFGPVERMLDMNVLSAVLAAHIAAKFGAPGCLVVLTGAQAARGPTPGMVAYGISKAATIHLVSSLAAAGSGLPDGARVAAIMPLTLDTPQNRAAMPDADFSSWTPLPTVAALLYSWANGVEVPANGALIDV